ncbi:MAG: hypothetical protein OEW68_15530 [Gammaproteobacteria bacterium]|nr:hypothetical protein [Gammaproteobacteria bacterium]MDH4316238.1 hypothetical protein [Gammaproteobacteria bacterium]MDH5214110.1 hypothetical protein [Gammaproteobacteria bacterium]
MDSRKDKPNIANRRAVPRTATGPAGNAEILQTRFAFGDEWSILDESDLGGDPYNNTGQHCVLKSKLVVDE